MMNAINELVNGNFVAAVSGFERELSLNDSDIRLIDGLSKALQGMGDFERALPYLEHVNAYQISNQPNCGGQSLAMATAHWCLGNRGRAIDLVRELCNGILSRTISMAPDMAGGATFGLILHYMAVTCEDKNMVAFSRNYLSILNRKYEKTPKRFAYPVHTAKQVLGLLDFEGALIGASGERTLSAAVSALEGGRQIRAELGVVLFHDGVLLRERGDEEGFVHRMRGVFDLGFRTESIRWYFARHELEQFPGN